MLANADILQNINITLRLSMEEAIENSKAYKFASNYNQNKSHIC